MTRKDERAGDGINQPKGGERPDQVACPGLSYSITAETCRARQGWGYPGCRRCRYRQDQRQPGRGRRKTRPR